VQYIRKFQNTGDLVVPSEFHQEVQGRTSGSSGVSSSSFSSGANGLNGAEYIRKFRNHRG
jgi:hypothetical protein